MEARITYYPNGKQKEKITYKDGKYNGLSESWYDNGQLKSKVNFKDGKEYGVFESWHENGQLKSKVNFKDGKEHGVSQMWHENGQLESKTNFKDGKRNGLYESWYNNGQLKWKESYKDSKEHGLSQMWHDNGQLESKINFKDGGAHGVFERWNENGKLVEKSYWENGLKKHDIPIDEETGPPKSKTKSYNKEIKALLDSKEANNEKFTAEDIAFIKQYSGDGGQKNAQGRGILDEYYTPDYICNFMYELAKKNGYTKGDILEPSIATGNIIEPFYKNKDFKSITGFEINGYSKKICELLYPKVELHNDYFETAFLQPERFTTLAKKTWLKNYPFDLVIGNPPYGKHTNKYSAYFTGKNKFKQIEFFFIYKGLELLKTGGLLIFITGQNFMRNTKSYEKDKQRIAQFAEFVDAYRLPKVFQTTDVPTDIFVFRKR